MYAPLIKERSKNNNNNILFHIIVLLLIIVSLGVTCIAYGSLRKDDLFEQGVTFLNKQGQTTTNVKFRGFSFKLQLISVCLMVLPFVIYMLLIIPTNKRYALKKQVKEDN